MKRMFILVTIMLACSGCKNTVHFFQQLEASEYGVVFRMLPLWLGGGVDRNVKAPGEMVVLMPWERLYRFDTRIKNIEWGAAGTGTDKEKEDYVQTRAFDGNEVSLSVRVQYHISKDPSQLVFLIQNMGGTGQAVEEIVMSAARADIRTYMNRLKTAQFFDNEQKYLGEAEIRKALQERFAERGIVITSVNLQEHRFERILKDGTIDQRYQEKINEVQTRMQETKREKLRKATVVADKKREMSEMQAFYNRKIEEAEGLKKQAVLRGEAYFEAKGNEAESILAKGTAEVEGIVEQINALSGPGGSAILRLEIAKRLIGHNPKFVLMGKQNKGEDISVNRIDANELIRQIGIIEGVKGPTRKSTTGIKNKTEELVTKGKVIRKSFGKK
jgi:hypothetical protein